MTSRTKPLPSIAPPRPHEGLFETVMANLRAKTDDEVIQQGVRLGIYTPDGFFTERYGGGDARISHQAESDLTTLERRTLQAVLDDARQFGVPPTLERIAKLVDTARPAQVLASLVRKGYLRQPYKGGAYIPLCGIDGSPVE